MSNTMRQIRILRTIKVDLTLKLFIIYTNITLFYLYIIIWVRLEQTASISTSIVAVEIHMSMLGAATTYFLNKGYLMFVVVFYLSFHRHRKHMPLVGRNF